MSRMVTAVVLAGAALLSAQFIQPQRPPAKAGGMSVWEDHTVPAAVRQILRRSCADCHSADTRWPWYSHLSPVSWMIARDVRRAREHLNLSAWPKNASGEKLEIATAISVHVMPPRRYLLIHHNAKLSPEEVETISKWAKQQ